MVIYEKRPTSLCAHFFRRLTARNGKTLLVGALCSFSNGTVVACDASCEAYRDIGKLYQKPEGALQSAGVIGRFQAQAVYVDGEAGDDTFSSGWQDEVRRSETSEEDTVIPLGGSGERHHSVYLGMNYYVWGDNLKFMFGFEYDDMESGSDDIYSGWTRFAAFRTYF